LLNNANKTIPLAEQAKNLLLEASHYADNSAKSLAALETKMEEIRILYKNMKEHGLYFNYGNAINYTDLDDIDSDDFYLSERLKSLNEQIRDHVTQLNNIYSNGRRYYGQTTGQLAVIHCYFLIYKFFGYRGIRSITPTPPKYAERLDRWTIRPFYRLLLSIYSRSIGEIYNPVKNGDIFNDAIKQLEIKDEAKVEALFARLR